MAKKEKIRYPNPEFWKCRDEIHWAPHWISSLHFQNSGFGYLIVSFFVFLFCPPLFVCD